MRIDEQIINIIPTISVTMIKHFNKTTPVTVHSC
jgi:hypothetical protein